MLVSRGCRSVLYVSGLVTGFASWLSPLCLLIVAGILYLYRYRWTRNYHLSILILSYFGMVVWVKWLVSHNFKEERHMRCFTRVQSTRGPRKREQTSHDVVQALEEGNRALPQFRVRGQQHVDPVCTAQHLCSTETIVVAHDIVEQARSCIVRNICLVSVRLFVFLPVRFIYGEAISALPMNGGAYNVLINTSSKPVASFAACLAVISYIATGVVSAATAVSYLQVIQSLRSANMPPLRRVISEAYRENDLVLSGAGKHVLAPMA